MIVIVKLRDGYKDVREDVNGWYTNDNVLTLYFRKPNRQKANDVISYAAGEWKQVWVSEP